MKSNAEIEAIAAQYPLRVRWSGEDDAFIGSIEGLAGDCHHGDDPQEVFATIRRLAVETVAMRLREGLRLPKVPSGELADPSPAAIRSSMGISQSKFAHMLGVSVSTLHKWEQNVARPSGAARALLRVAALRPEAVREALAS